MIADNPCMVGLLSNHPSFQKSNKLHILFITKAYSIAHFSYFLDNRVGLLVPMYSNLWKEWKLSDPCSKVRVSKVGLVLLDGRI